MTTRLLALLLFLLTGLAHAQTTSTTSTSTLPPGTLTGDGGGFRSFALQDGNFCPTTSNGHWIDVGNYREGWLDVTGITTATVVVQGANTATRPADSASGYTIKSITADEHWTTAIDTGEASVILRLLPRWVKASISSCTTDAGAGITVVLVARRAPAL